MTRIPCATLAAAVTMTASVAGAQPATDAARPSFAVVSVRPNPSPDPRATLPPLEPNGRYSARNASLRLLIEMAHRTGELTGLPDWAETDKFDIEARADGTPSEREIVLMLQSMLADRFNLVTHREMRPKPVYALVAAEAGRLGPRLRPHTDDGGCIEFLEALKRGPAAPSQPLPTPPCGGWSGSPNQGRLAGQAVSMEMLAQAVARQLDRPVVERTNLTGPFDLEIEWLPQRPSPAAPPSPPDPNLSSIFTAVQEQLGLRLVPDMAPLEVLVIDHVERPSEN